LATASRFYADKKSMMSKAQSDEHSLKGAVSAQKLTEACESGLYE
jgi:hypothetical protein